MANNKPILGYDDNLSPRLQDTVPTQYAVGKLRAARTPYGPDGQSVINNANRILRPGLYVMELNVNTVNVKDGDGNNLTSGILYLYQIVVDPDESVHGGHVTTSSSVIMNVRQIAYYHNGTTEKVLTRVGTPLSSYSGSSVNLLSEVQTGQSGYVFVREIGTWVRRQSGIELAVTWTAWREFGQGSDNPSAEYTFLNTITNGVQLNIDTNNQVTAAGIPATYQTFGVVKTIGFISSIQTGDYGYYVPTATAVYDGLMAISRSIQPIVDVANQASAAARNASNAATTANNSIQDHINNHPDVPYATYNATTATAGKVVTTPTIKYINENYDTAKYTVPTVNAVYNTSAALANAIGDVNTALTTHLNNHPGAEPATYQRLGIVLPTTEITATESQDVVPSINALVSVSNSLYAHVTNMAMHASAPIATPYNVGTVSVVTALPTPGDSLYQSQHIVPHIGLLANVSNQMMNVSASLLAHVTNTGIHGGGTGGIAKVEGVAPLYGTNTNSVALRYTTNTSNGVGLVVAYDANNKATLAAGAQSAGLGTMGTVETTNNITENANTWVVPTISALWKVSSALNNHATNNAIHGGGGGLNSIGSVLPIYISNTNSVCVSEATTGAKGVVKVTTTVQEVPYDFVVPTATAVWQAIRGITPGGVGSGSIAAPSYYTPFGWSVPSGATTTHTGTGGANGGWILISIVCTGTAQGCVGMSVNGNYIHLFSCPNGADTKVLPIPAGASITIYDGTGGAASIMACGYGSVSVTATT